MSHVGLIPDGGDISPAAQDQLHVIASKPSESIESLRGKESYNVAVENDAVGHAGTGEDNYRIEEAYEVALKASVSTMQRAPA